MQAPKSLTARKTPTNARGADKGNRRRTWPWVRVEITALGTRTKLHRWLGRLKSGAVRSGSREQQIREYHRTLYAAWGPQHWWPARTRFEVIVGAYLTQNTSWNNVEAALRRLRGARALSLAAIRAVSIAQLESLIRPAGYFRQKAARLKFFVDFVDRRYAGSLSRMLTQPTAKLRAELLALNGVGPETADSILLYAGQHEVFVVDAYTRRILDRHGILPANADYEEIRGLFERALSVSATTSAKPQSVPGRNPPISSAHQPSPMSLLERSPLAQVYNDMHGLIVAVGKHYCLKSRAECEGCPLQKFLP
jgi:endonuclease III related protein